MKWIFRDERDTKFFSFFVPLFVSLDFQIIIRMMNKTKLILYIILTTTFKNNRETYTRNG